MANSEVYFVEKSGDSFQLFDPERTFSGDIGNDVSSTMSIPRVSRHRSLIEAAGFLIALVFFSDMILSGYSFPVHDQHQCYFFCHAPWY